MRGRPPKNPRTSDHLERLARLRAAVQSGTYVVDADATAAAVLADAGGRHPTDCASYRWCACGENVIWRTSRCCWACRERAWAARREEDQPHSR